MRARRRRDTLAFNASGGVNVGQFLPAEACQAGCIGGGSKMLSANQNDFIEANDNPTSYSVLTAAIR